MSEEEEETDIGLPLDKALFIGIMSVCLVLSWCSNVCIVIVVLKNKRLRTATNLLISNLAVADICMAMFIIPMQIHDITHASEFHEG